MEKTPDTNPAHEEFDLEIENEEELEEAKQEAGVKEKTENNPLKKRMKKSQRGEGFVICEKQGKFDYWDGVKEKIQKFADEHKWNVDRYKEEYGDIKTFDNEAILSSVEEINKNEQQNSRKAGIISFNLSRFSFGEQEKGMEQLKKMQQNDIQEIGVVFLECGHLDCYGRCEGPFFEAYKMIDDIAQKNPDINFSYIEDIYANKEEIKKLFLEDLKEKIPQKDLVENIAEKTGKEKEEIVELLKKFFYKCILYKDQLSDRERDAYKKILTANNFNGVEQDDKELLFLFLIKFLNKEIDYKIFINKLIEIDYEMSQDFLKKLIKKN